MKKGELVALLESVTMEELKSAIPVKEKMERLDKKRKRLEKALASVVRQLKSLGMPTAAAAPVRAVKKGLRKAKRRRIAQPSLSSLLVQILQEEKKPLNINALCDALLKEKGYQTRAKDFKAQVRVMMYRNDKGLFDKAGPGLFKLAARVQPKGTTKKKVAKRTTKRAKRSSRKRTQEAIRETAKQRTKKAKK